MKTRAAAVADRAKAMQASAGLMERAWRGGLWRPRRAWDAGRWMSGRPDNSADKIKDIQERIRRAGSQRSDRIRPHGCAGANPSKLALA